MAIDAISREKAEALIREQLTNTIQQDVPKSSIVMQLGTRLANMTSNQTKIPVLSMLPLAYWVNGDTGMKQTSKQEWDNVYMTAAELAVIVPVPEAVLADSTFDIMGEVQPRVREAMGAKIDNAILFGGERPTEWTTDILTLAAKNKVPGPIDYTKLLGKDGLFLLALTNQVLSAMGKPILPIDSTELEQLVTAGCTTVAALISWWYNNSYTQAALAADEVYEQKKNSVH